jgi:hypothetical protein
MRRLVLTFIIFCLAATGQTRSGVAPHQRVATAVRPGASDAEIEKTIRAKFAASKIAADQYTVKVQSGVATIEGRSDVVQRKGTATRLAKAGGAVKVVNKIQLSQAARDKASQNLDKGRRRAQVKRGDARSSN